MMTMGKEKRLVMADRLISYAIERQNGIGRHQPPGAPPWTEQRRFWTDAILQGMARLEGQTPDPGLMEEFDRRLEAAHSCFATETLPVKEQAALIRGLRRYISALEATGDDHRRQIAVVEDLLSDMATHRSWGLKESVLAQAREQAENALFRMTAQMPIRFTRIIMGGDAGPHWASGFAPGAVTDAEAVKQTAVYQEAVRDFPEVKSWPVICTVYMGRGLRFESEAVDATAFDLEIMGRAGDRFLDQRGVRWTCGFYQMAVSTEPEVTPTEGNRVVDAPKLRGEYLPEALTPAQDGAAMDMSLTM